MILLPRLKTGKWTFPLMQMDVPTFTLNIKEHRWPTILPIQNYSPFQTLPSRQLYCLVSTWKALHTSFSLHLTPRLYFKTIAKAPCDRLIPAAPVSRSRRRSWTCFQEVCIIVLIVCLSQGKWYCYRKLDVSMTLRNKLRVFASHLQTLRKKNQSRYWGF